MFSEIGLSLIKKSNCNGFVRFKAIFINKMTQYNKLITILSEIQTKIQSDQLTIILLANEITSKDDTRD